MSLTLLCKEDCACQIHYFCIELEMLSSSEEHFLSLFLIHIFSKRLLYPVNAQLKKDTTRNEA